jgi:hypothetical protein
LVSAAADTPERLRGLFCELADQDGSFESPVAGVTAAGVTAAGTTAAGATAGTAAQSAKDIAARAIEIEGRLIPVVAESGGVVWFDFMAICSGPRSQDDYIEIARNYQSVIVSNIPVLDTLLENEARRFIALVDELYDRNVNLIVSAAAPPTELYRGDRVAFAFERTASRLIEMQSEEYLAASAAARHAASLRATTACRHGRIDRRPRPAAGSTDLAARLHARGLQLLSQPLIRDLEYRLQLLREQRHAILLDHPPKLHQLRRYRRPRQLRQ